MTMTHKEALLVAMDRAGVTVFEEDYDTFIRAYIEARGMVLVPDDPTQDMVFAGLLEMKRKSSIQFAYYAIPAAAPDPFEDGE